MESDLFNISLTSPGSFTASRGAAPDRNVETFDDSVRLDQELSASGSYTLTKVECTTLQSTISRLSTPGTTAPKSTRAPRSADIPEEDMRGMVKDSILARIDQGEACCMYIHKPDKLSISCQSFPFLICAHCIMHVDKLTCTKLVL